jgi:prepilin-type N-terminal cleavage/methylation domain-containing protein
MPADRTQGDSGFTLIETIVALVILASAVAVFSSFLSGQLNGAGRVEQAADSYDRHMNALEIATAINPMATPQGTFDLGTYRIAWSSQLIGEVRQSSRYPAGRGIFKVGLYRITFSFIGDTQTAPIAVTRLGYRRDNEPSFTGSAN